MYLYILYNYIFDDYYEGRIYSHHKLEVKDLEKLLIKSIKIVGENKGEFINIVCDEANKILGTTPNKKNIEELVDIRYYFANSCNCGGYEGNEEIYDWLSDFNRPSELRSQRFYTWWEPTSFNKRLYSPVRFGLRF